MFTQLKKYALLGVLALTGLVVFPTVADDRDLLRDASGQPYFFVILDTSGSMNWTTACSMEDAATDLDPYDGMCTSTCPMAAATCAQVCPNVGCTEYLNDANAATITDIVVDDIGRYKVNNGPVVTDASYVTTTGSINTTNVSTLNFGITSPSNDTGADYNPSGDSANDRTLIVLEGNNGSITFSPVLPKAGLYHVSTFIRFRNNGSSVQNATNARIEISFGDGTQTKYLEFDQRGTGSSNNVYQFHHLGTFNFTPGVGGIIRPKVKFTTQREDGTSASLDGDLYADAVRFVSVPDAAGNTCVATGYRCQQPVCPDGDCAAPLGGEDPSSKLFQAKYALHEVLDQVDGVQFGFGHYENDNIRAGYKHWMYRVSATKPNGTPQDVIKIFDNGKISYPEAGTYDMLGTGPPWDTYGNTTSTDDNEFHCNSGIDDNIDTRTDINAQIGCRADYPADLRDLWEMDRLRNLPKLGRTGDVLTSLYIRDYETATNKFRTYRVDFKKHFTSIPLVSFGGNTYPTVLGNKKIGVEVQFWNCGTNTIPIGTRTCSSPTNAGSGVVYYDLVSDWLPYHLSIGRYPMNGNGYLNNMGSVKVGAPGVSGSDDQCVGMEENTDWDDSYDPDSLTDANDDDAFYAATAANGYSFRWPLTKDSRGEKDWTGATLPKRVNYFDRADMVPLDWTRTNRGRVQRRLAPNQENDASAPPDFRIATYFHDTNVAVDLPSSPNSERRLLRLRDDVKLQSGVYVPDMFAYVNDIDKPRPLLGIGSTPLDGSLKDFKTWYDQWKKWAQVYDVDWICRQRYILFLTDGDETCATSVTAACTTAKTLLDSSQIKTFVVGFGLPKGSGDALTCMASNGGTSEPFYPRNKDELVESMLEILDTVKAQSRAFASASIPAVQSTAADKIYLSSFTPIRERALWPGRLDAFLEPLPLTATKQPDLKRDCGGSRQSGCHLWDAADKILSQAPTASDLAGANPNYKLSNTVGTRRVFYGQDTQDGARSKALRLFRPPKKNTYTGSNEDRLDLAAVMVPPSTYAQYPATVTDAALDALLHQAVAQTLVKKTYNLEIEIDGTPQQVGCTGNPDLTPCTYVMGDIFHANPLVVTGPANFTFFTEDLCEGEPRKGVIHNCNSLDGRGYREYVRSSLWRRRMLMTATNDGQIHVFDAGTHQRITDTESGDIDVFTNGTGLEIFSYMPRLTMPALREQLFGTRHIFSADGSLTAADAFIDPVGAVPEAEDREWRTLVIGGLREGGDVYLEGDDVADYVPGYFALDLTKPDILVDEASVDEIEPLVPATEGATIPTCLNAEYSGSGKQLPVPGCVTRAGEDVPFPLELWTFKDTIKVRTLPTTPVTYQEYYFDEDRGLNLSSGLHTGGYTATKTPNGRDLGATWSRPVIGQIAICKTGGVDCSRNKPDDLETRWVAIFGGGMDAPNKANPVRGTWLYMVDVETGQAIYKRQLQGAAPSDPAVLDMDQDGVFDAIYIGTTEGLLYKVSLRPANTTTRYPSLKTFTARSIRDQLFNAKTNVVWGAEVATGENGPNITRVDDLVGGVNLWDPFPILYTGGENMPIYFPPAMFNIPERDQYGGLLLLGDRENLWEEIVVADPDAFMPRVFVFVDDNLQPGTPVITASDLVGFDVDTGNPQGDLDLLLAPPTGKKPGWVMNAPANWRGTGEPFLIAGITVFSLFDPTITRTAARPCAHTGTTYAFALNVRNANPLSGAVDSGDGSCTMDTCCGRCFTIDEFTTAIHTTSTVTKNKPVDREGDRPAGGYFGDAIEGADQEGLKSLINAVRDSILQALPSTCQYNDKYQISLAVLRNSTGLNELARIPIVVCPADWKD
jgi:hypothetical protein